MSSYTYSEFPSLLPLFAPDPTLRTTDGMTAYLPAILIDVDLRTLLRSSLWRETGIIDTALKVYYYAPYLMIAGGGARLFWNRARLDDREGRRRYLGEFALWAFGSMLIVLVTLNRPQDYVHLVVLYWPMLLLLLVWSRALVRGRRGVAWLLAVLLAWPAYSTLAYTGHLAQRLRDLYTEPIESPRGGVRVQPGQARIIDDLVAYIQAESAPDEPVAVLPYFPIVQFYADRRGPHRSSYIVWPFPEFPDRDRRVIDAMEAQRTRLLVYGLNEFAFFEGMDVYAPELFSYLVEHYEIDRLFNTRYAGYKLAAAKRVDPTTEGRPLHAESLPAVSLSVNPESGAPRPIEPLERSTHLLAGEWPLRPVLALRPTAGGRTVLTVETEVPERATLLTAIGVHPRRWDMSPTASVRFELAVVDGDRRETIFSRVLQPMSRLEDRGWIEVEAPLADRAGRPITLELSTGTDRPEAEHLLMAGWALPRIVHDSAAEGAPDPSAP
jgi:hypothetical protein